MKPIRGKKPPLTAAGLHVLRDEYSRTIEPARALASKRRQKGECRMTLLQVLRPDSRGD